MTKIIVVGGGAGGLELATKLGRTLGRKRRAEITLVDKNSSHLWKPLLHEVATGSMDEGVDALSYRAHAKNHGFDFQMGTLWDIDRDQKVITLAPMYDENNELLMPERELEYDILVMAIGSTSNDFNTPGVRDNCIFLDNPKQAHRFRREMNNEFMRLHAKHGDGSVDIAIVGAGATGVAKADEEGLETKEGERIHADIMVWAAGIKAPDFLKDIASLETNRINQLEVNNTLQTTRDENIFVIGDCAACTQEDGSKVPPRAQSAHQMASRCFSNIVAKLNGRELKPYVFKDHGSLVSLSRFSTVGSLMGNLTKGSMMIEGRIARMVYISLYRMHQIALHGYVKTGLMMLVGRINRVLRPSLKLH
ncbi:NAD(P)/FAD-dependent oxidoreductase [Salinivibrio sp. IB282]|uniref:NAD(P)/FAD-dependent oxidoreductase n=1 Tax=Salinivibrio sp. IB282 TaxID=1766122 RepID=UPI0009886987|nr:NAD(P)/FAD-dependent oxidoreductase [Salinivibrio sp. IB282]OOE69790.1 FAD-dependent oxidoreductase [Salinivibrio sp. IB282]